MARAMLERSSAENAAAEERFRSLAAEALVANARALDADNRRSLDAALAPMARRIQEMEKTFRETYSAEARERFSLADRVRERRLLPLRWRPVGRRLLHRRLLRWRL